MHDCPCRLWRCWLPSSTLRHGGRWSLPLSPAFSQCLPRAVWGGSSEHFPAEAQAKKPGVVLFLGMKSQKLVFCGPWPSSALPASAGSHRLPLGPMHSPTSSPVPASWSSSELAERGHRQYMLWFGLSSCLWVRVTKRVFERCCACSQVEG